MTAKWKRVRPGLYRLHSNDGERIAEIERGAESRAWYWWTAWGDVGRSESLVLAQAEVGQVLSAK